MAYLTGMMPLRAVHKPPYTVEVPDGPRVKGETIPRRHPRARDGLITRPADDIDTVFGIIGRSARLYPDEPAMGSRRLIDMHKETKKVKKMIDGELREVDKEWQYFELSKYEYTTFKELETIVLQIGAGLRKLGMAPGDKLHMFATTSAHWMTMAHGAASQSISIVTAYDTLGASGVRHSLTQTSARAMYVDPQLLKTVASAVEDAKDLKIVVYNDTSLFSDGREIEPFKKKHPHLTVIGFEELRALGEENPIDATPPKPEDLYCIMYTSGSTGPPKGVPMTHAGILAAISGLLICVDECVSRRDSVLAYLPLAHMFELCLENLALFVGATLGYGTARTLTDGSMRHCAGDMREFRPTAMVGVPQVWESVRKGVEAKVAASGAIGRSVFWTAYAYKKFMASWGLPGARLFDGIAFGKVADMTGGRLRLTMNGASGIAAGTREFLSVVLAPMLTGYGLTETATNGALGCPLEYTGADDGAIGPVPGAVEVKLASLPELGYSADGEGGRPPQGEILIRGPAVFKGYFNNDEETARVLSADGWFRTGDVGEFNANGHLRVIDRAKNLVKMQGGEYVALEKLESVYVGSQLVQAVMVEASGEYPRAVAVVAPNERNLAELAGRLGVDAHDMHRSEKVRAAVAKDLADVGRRGGLVGMEIVAGVVLVEDEWTPASGLVTATSKVNRRAIRERYAKEIKECFGHE